MLESTYYNTKKIYDLKDLFADICDKTRFNKSKRNLYSGIKEIQKYFS